jgi:hypothetical protein
MTGGAQMGEITTPPNVINFLSLHSSCSGWGNPDILLARAWRIDPQTAPGSQDVWRMKTPHQAVPVAGV